MQKRPCLLVGMNVSQGDWTAGSPTSFTSACIPVLASMIMNLFLLWGDLTTTKPTHLPTYHLLPNKPVTSSLLSEKLVTIIDCYDIHILFLYVCM